MTKRILGLFCTFLLLFSGLIVRIYLLSQTGSYAAAAQNQSSYLLEIARTRGCIYDHNFTPLVGQETALVAAVTPSPEAAAALFPTLPDTEQETLLQHFERTRPFLLPVEEAIYSPKVEVFTTQKRYGKEQLAANVIGYVDGEGQGVSGIESAYNAVLEGYGGSLSLRYTMDATGRPLTGAAPQVVDGGYNRPGGVVLTLDADIQRAAEEASARYFQKGAVVVMDVHTGELRALVSLPTYDPNDVAKSLTDPNSPLINRALWDYSVGSTFKVLVETVAIEHGYRTHQNDCPGYIMVEDVRINCHNLTGHGPLDQRTALEKSCNPYFVSLIQQVGGESVAYKAGELGFGRAIELAPGLISSAGSLPSFTDLAMPAETANLGFGQGKLSATPIQIAQLIAAIANGGDSVQPKLVAGFTEDGKALSKATPSYSPVQVLDPDATQLVRQDMVSVVENGSGQKAKPDQLGAGGKTGSAQTGRYDENGSELVHAWFAGFFPAEDPQYAIVVLAEEMDSGGDYAAPVFAEICNEILKNGKLYD